MGEAKRRKQENEKLKQETENWVSTLVEVEQTVATVALRAFDRIVEQRKLVSGCYLLAFFLNEYLRSQHAIQTELIVGWVNDGNWAGMASHAWITLDGKKIDISLVRTDNPEAQLPGDLIILDRIVLRGKAKYSYHREQSPEAISYIQKMIRDGSFPADLIALKDSEHAIASAAAASPAGVLKFLKDAPRDRDFDTLMKWMA